MSNQKMPKESKNNRRVSGTVILHSVVWAPALTHDHDVKVEARLHGFLPHLLDDSVNTDVAQQGGSTARAVRDTVTSIMGCSVTSSVADPMADPVGHTVGHAVAADVHRAVTPNGHRDAARRERRDAAPDSDARALGGEGVGWRGGPYIGGLSGNDGLGSHFGRNYV